MGKDASWQWSNEDFLTDDLEEQQVKHICCSIMEARDFEEHGESPDDAKAQLTDTVRMIEQFWAEMKARYRKPRSAVLESSAN